MTTQRARSPRDGTKIDLHSLHTRFNQVAQIVRCLRISIESGEEPLQPAEVCRAVGDLLDDINSDLWTFLEPALLQKIEARDAARRTGPLRKPSHTGAGLSNEPHGPLETNALGENGSGVPNGDGADGDSRPDAAH